MEIAVATAMSVYSDQAPRSAMSDLGLHCFPTPLLWNARNKLVKKNRYTFRGSNSVGANSFFLQ